MKTAPFSLSVLLMAGLLAAAFAHAQSPGAAAAAAQPSMSGTQGGTQPTLQQGGMSTNAKDASQVNIQLRRPGQPDMPTGAPASSMPPAQTATATMAPLPVPAASQKR
jgi:type 1 fimbria pilin